MTEQNLEQSIFLHAIGLASPVDRAVYLDQACRNSPELRAEVDALLAAHDRLGGAAPSPIQPEPTQAPSVPPVDDDVLAVGPYKLLEQIGEGGMGVVWMAEQKEPIHRRVALKVIKAGMDSKQVLARFEAERQALALMDHPNIARVLDAGVTATGRPYFVMELVKGAPITQYCDDKHLSVRERLELFGDVCRAVQHAHQKGIIHRDLKPSNILIAPFDGKPVVKVIDFGVAKATGQRLTDATLFTGFGAVVGTPEYMSPEQAETNNQDIDTRSDIYSLGVLLYELLTGSTPLTKKRVKEAALVEVLRVIREEEPPKPSTRLSSTEELPSISAQRHTEPAKLTSLVRGELDWIVMKSLEKDRNRRYETANGFAQDVQRYLANEPVQACPPSAAYRFRKFVRRNKATLATATMVAVALVTGIIGTSWQAIRATREADRATYEANEANSARAAALAARNTARQKEAEAIAALEQVELQRRQANKNFDKARRAVDEYLTQVTESELLTVPGLQPLREDLLQAALKFYAEFTQERAEDPTLLRELASAHYRLAKIQSDLGNAAAAQAANLEAVRLFEKLRGQDPESVDLQANLASAYLFAGRNDDTVKLCQAVMKIQPEHAEIRSLLADTYNQLAVNDKSNGAVALKYHQQAFELRDALVRDFPENPRYLAQLGGTINNLGVLLSNQGKREEALAMFERAVEYSAQAYERAPHSILWGRWLCLQLLNVASHQVQLHKQDEALRSYERLVAICRKRAFENPAIGALRGDLYQAYLNLGNFQKRLGDAAAGARCFRLAREMLEQIPRETPDQLLELAIVYAELASPADSLASDEVDEAERQRNADLAMETLGKAVEAGYQNASVLATSADLDVLRGRDDFQALLATVQKLAEVGRLVKGKEANAATKLTSYKQAADLLKGLPNAQMGQVRHRATLAATLHSIAVVQTELKLFNEAGKMLDEVLKLRQELVNEQSGNPLATVDVLSTRAAMGQLGWERDRPEDAHRIWQEILTECQKLAVDHASNAPLQTQIVGVERSIGNAYGEIGLWKETLHSVDRGLKSGQLFDAAGDCRSAHVLAALGRLEEHRKLCQLIADKWGKSSPAQTVWAATMNPQPVVESTQLLELAERVIKSNLDPLWKFKAATAWYRAGDYDRALEIMLDARENVVASGSSACLHWYAMVYHKLGQKEVAATYFEEAEAKYLNSADNCLRGSVKSAVKDAHGGSWGTWAEDQAARRAAWTELRGEDDLADPWQHLIQARAFQLIGEQKSHGTELAAAEKAWQRLLERTGDDPLPWIHRGRWYTERGQHEKADADFAHAATLTPDELNKFLEAGWWASTASEGLAPLFPPRTGETPTPAEPAVPISTTVIHSAPYWHGQEVKFQNAPEFKEADTAYAMAYVYAPETKGVTLLVGGAASVELRLNGRRVYESKTYRSPFYAERVPVLLRAGRNTLVARVPNPSRAQSLIVRIGDNPLDRGLELAQFGLWDEALPLLNAEFAAGRRPNEQVWSMYSGLLSATGDFAGYRELYHKVLNWIGDSPSWSVSLHASQSCTGAPVPESDIARLVRLVDDGAAKASANSKRWAASLQSTVYFRAGRYQEVLDRNQTGGWRQPTLRALCWHHLGSANKANSELARAEREFLEVVRMGPEGPASAAVLNSARGLQDILSDYALLREARTLIAADMPPDDPALQALIAQTRQQLEAADPRLLPFELALISSGTRPEAWLERGRARAMLGQSESAQADFAKALAIAPDDPEVLAARALIYAELDRIEEAVADVAKVLDKDGDSAKSPGWLAARQRLYEEQGQWPKLFEWTTKLRPADPDPWIARARYFASRGHWRNSVDGASQRREERGDLDQAMADLREAIARGFRDFDQNRSDAGWQALQSLKDFQELVREMAERRPDDLMLLAKLEGHTERICAVAFLPDGKRLVSIGRDNQVCTWDLETRSVISKFPVTGGNVGEEADVSPDGRFVAVIIGTGVRIWDLENGKQICEMFPQNVAYLNHIRFSPDGTRVVTCGKPYDGVLWDASTGEQVQQFEMDESHPHAIEFSPDGQRLAMGADGRVRLFDVGSGHVLGDAQLPQNQLVLSLAFAPSGDSLACGQMGGHATVIDVNSRRVTGTLINPESSPHAHVLSMRFLDGKQVLLITRFDGAFEVWDLAQTKIVATATSGDGTGKRLAVSPDCHYAVTAHGEVWDHDAASLKRNGDYELRLWQLPRTVWPEPKRPSSGAAVSEP